VLRNHKINSECIVKKRRLQRPLSCTPARVDEREKSQYPRMSDQEPPICLPISKDRGDDDHCREKNGKLFLRASRRRIKKCWVEPRSSRAAEEGRPSGKKIPDEEALALFPNDVIVKKKKTIHRRIFIRGKMR